MMDKVKHFTKRIDHQGNFIARIEYSPIFTKTDQGGSKKTREPKAV